MAGGVAAAASDDPATPVVVLHAPGDEAFVRGFLVPALGAGRPITVLDVATASLAELDRSLHGPGVTIAVITPALLADPRAQQAELLASSSALAGEREVVPLWLEDCALPLHLAAVVKTDFRRRAAWDDEIARLRGHLDRPAPVDEPPACPYPGMRPFETRDTRRFHGRDAEIVELVRRIDAGERELYVIGPSGCGKSSLIAAGVIPRLVERGAVVVRTLRPGAAPMRHLAGAFGAGGDDSSAIAAAAVALVPADARLVVVVDQLEELFVQAPRDDHARFAGALRAIAEAVPRSTVVLTLRADFFSELLQSELWGDAARPHVDLRPLRGAALREAIERPAREIGVYCEPGLVDRLLADAANEPGVLPLLQETLVQLWSRRRHRLLTCAAYDAMASGGQSGLAIAIATRAERCLAALPVAQRTIARRILLRLVSFGDGRPNTRRRQTCAELAAAEPPAAFDAVLRELVAARLVTMDEDDRPDGDRVDRVDLCHDVLVTAWPAFAEWVETRRTDERRRRELQASAEDWAARGRGTSGLLDDVELAAALAWRASDAACELGETALVEQLVEASRRALRRARTRRRWLVIAVIGGLATVAAIATILGLVASDQATTARAERATVVQLLAKARVESGRLLVAEGRPHRAIPYLVAAREQSGEQSDDAQLLKRLFRIATRSPIVFALAHDTDVRSVTFSHDGAWVVTASGHTAQLWDAATGARVGRPLEHPSELLGATSDGRRVFAVGWTRMWIWDLRAASAASAAPAASSEPIDLPHPKGVTVFDLSSDGRLLVTGGGRVARVWDTATGAPLTPPLEHDDLVDAVELSPDGARLLTSAIRGPARVWDVATGAVINTLGSTAMRAAFDPKARRVLTIRDRSVDVWDTIAGSVRHVTMRASSLVGHAMFTADGVRIVTVTDRGTVQLWNAVVGVEIGEPIVHPAPLSRLALSEDGSQLMTLCLDGAIRIWDTSTQLLTAAPLEAEGRPRDAALHPDGKRVVAASPDGVARVWHVTPSVVRVLGTSNATGGGFDPTGEWIAALAGDKIHLWAARDHRASTYPVAWNSHRIVFAPDGRHVATITGRGEIEIRDRAGRLVVASKDARGTREVTPFAFSSDGRRFASMTATDKRAAMIWDIATGRALTGPMTHGGPLTSVAFSPDGQHLLTTSADGPARLWSASTGESAGELRPADKPGQRVDAVFDPSGRWIAAVGDRDVALWNAAERRLERVFVGHSDTIDAIAFSRDGARFATASRDYTARVWRTADEHEVIPSLVHNGPVTRVAFAPDGYLVTASETVARVWDAETGRPLTDWLAHGARIDAISISPDGASLVTIGRHARLWDLGADTRSLAEWRQIAATSYPQLAQQLLRQAP